MSSGASRSEYLHEPSRSFRDTWLERSAALAVAWCREFAQEPDGVDPQLALQTFRSVLAAKIREFENSPGEDLPQSINQRAVYKIWGSHPSGHPATPLSKNWENLISRWLREGIDVEHLSRRVPIQLAIEGGRTGQAGKNWPDDLEDAFEALFSDPGVFTSPRNLEIPDDVASWDDVVPHIKTLALATRGDPHFRVLGLTMGRAWAPLTRSVLPALRRAGRTDVVFLDLVQFDPAWPGLAYLHPGYAQSCHKSREQLMRQLEAVTLAHGPVSVRLRQHRTFLGLTGVAVGDDAYVGLVGGEETRVVAGRPYALASRRAETGANWLFLRFEEAWAEVARTETTIVDWTAGHPLTSPDQSG